MYGGKELIKEDTTPIDLEPYISGKKKMGMKCRGYDNSGCGKTIDITKEYIQCETQNNIRKKAPDYRSACDELVIHSKKCDSCKTVSNKGSVQK